jgi:hypothetical protein
MIMQIYTWRWLVPPCTSNPFLDSDPIWKGCENLHREFDYCHLFFNVKKKNICRHVLANTTKKSIRLSHFPHPSGLETVLSCHSPPRCCGLRVVA